AQLVSWARSEYSRVKTARQNDVYQWYYNISMYYGKQYYDIIKMPNGNRTMGIPQATTPRVRHTVNRVRPMIRSEIARMTSQKPVATVTPAPTSDSDTMAAQAAEQVWNFLQDRRKYQQKMTRNAFWTSITGTGFMKTWWDAEYSKDTALLAATRQPAIGDVLMDAVTPFNILVPDLLEPEIE